MHSSYSPSEVCRYRVSALNWSFSWVFFSQQLRQLQNLVIGILIADLLLLPAELTSGRGVSQISCQLRNIPRSMHGFGIHHYQRLIK